jgi:hypothetical protein
MAEENTQLVNVTFAVKQPGPEPYSNEELRMTITQCYPDTFGGDDLIVESASLAQQVKAEVYKAGHIGFNLDDDGLIVRRLSAGVPSGNDVRQGASTAAKPSAANREPNRAPAEPRQVSGKSAMWQTLIGMSDKERRDTFFDNRADMISGKRNNKGPWFKRRGEGIDEPYWAADIPSGHGLNADDMAGSFDVIPDFAYTPK